MLPASLGIRTSADLEAASLTRWGLANAVMAEARTAPSALMLELERLGGELRSSPPAEASPPRAPSSGDREDARRECLAHDAGASPSTQALSVLNRGRAS